MLYLRNTNQLQTLQSDIVRGISSPVPPPPPPPTHNVTYALGGGSGSSDTSSDQGTSQTETEAAPVAVTAEQLLSELESNALAAKNSWKDKRVTITGTLGTIDASGDYFSLRGDNEFAFINVQVFIDDSFIDTVSAFNKGQTVKVTGVISDVGEILGYSVKAQSIP